MSLFDFDKYMVGVIDMIVNWIQKKKIGNNNNKYRNSQLYTYKCVSVYTNFTKNTYCI